MKAPIYTGAWGKCHIQGIAVDLEKGYIYYSFTTKLIKSTLDGEIVGSVDGLMGHLGCIAFNREDGRVYGSLEYKQDAIGKGILKNIGSSAVPEDGFYIVMFDVDKIDRMDMDAEKDGIMTSVYLKEVVDDYKGTGLNRQGEAVAHRHGCSGIDGTTFGPMPGAPANSKQYLFVCYGVYSDLTRADNDYQVMLCYDTADWAKYEQPLRQEAMHKWGPEAPTEKFFVFTGNTNYGVQNLEYDPYKQAYLMAVYPGRKPEYPNYGLFAVDAAAAPEVEKLQGMEMEGKVLKLLDEGRKDEKTGLRGWKFAHGTTGLYACGDGTYYISENHICQSGQCGLIYKYVWDEKEAFVLED